MHDFELVTILKLMARVLATRQDFTVEFNRHTAFAQGKPVQNLGNGQPVSKVLRFAIDVQLHANRSVIKRRNSSLLS